MYDVRLLTYIAAQREFVRITFLLTEDHCASVAATVDLKYCADCGRTIVVAAADCIVLNTRVWYTASRNYVIQ